MSRGTVLISIMSALLLSGCPTSPEDPYQEEEEQGNWFSFQTGRVLTYDLQGENQQYSYTGVVTRTDLEPMDYEGYPYRATQVYPVEIVTTKYLPSDTTVFTQYQIIYQDDSLLAYKYFTELPDTVIGPLEELAELPMQVDTTTGGWEVHELGITCTVPAGVFDNCAHLSRYMLMGSGYEDFDMYLAYNLGTIIYSHYCYYQNGWSQTIEILTSVAYP
jgi:hypothetical protein